MAQSNGVTVKLVANASIAITDIEIKGVTQISTRATSPMK
jgi:hypothetical protein